MNGAIGATRSREVAPLSRDAGDFDTFRAQVSRTTEAADWPFALTVDRNVPVYDGQAVRETVAAGSGPALMAEWLAALSTGPGVIAIKRALADGSVLDRATAIFDAIIEQQRRSQTGGGDHFAKPGANDRIWNALQKHCLSDPENFAAYYGNVAIDLVCRAWLGDGYQMTAQVNRVNPGGEAQTAHRDYHLGFMTPERLEKFPAHSHRLSPVLTLQGAVAHCDMPIESGPTQYLPYSQTFLEGYVAYGRPEYQRWFADHRVQLPLAKGDAVFFNPALMHAAGANVTKDTYRTANLLQVSSALGRATEAIDRTRMVVALYPALHAGLKAGTMTQQAADCAVAASAEGYAFPTNLDNDPPIGGLAPKTQADLMREALRAGMSPEVFATTARRQAERRNP